MAKSEIAPHVCPQCGSPCYQGAFALECTGQKCDHYHADTAAAYKAERFPSVDSIEDDPTQPDGFIRVMVDGKPTLPRSTGSFRWPSVAPAAVFPDTDEGVADMMRDAVKTAKADPRCTPDDAKELDSWLADMLKEYISAFGEKWIGTHIEAKRNAQDPKRLDVKIQLTRVIPVVTISGELDMGFGGQDIKVNPDGKIPLVSDIHQPKGTEFPGLHEKVTAYVDGIRRQQEKEMMDYFAAIAEVPTDIAFGQDLDKWARIWGCDRRPGETDADLRKRINGASMFSPGSSL